MTRIVIRSGRYLFSGAALTLGLSLVMPPAQAVQGPAGAAGRPEPARKASPVTPEHVLSQSHPGPVLATWSAAGPLARVRLAVAMNPKCPPDTLARLARDPSDLIRQAVAANPACPDEVKAKLAADEDQAVVEALLENPKPPGHAVLDQLTAGQQPKVYELLAANPRTPADILRKLAHVPTQTEFLLLSLSRNPSVPPDVVMRLVKIGDRLVRTFLARQPKLGA